MLVDSFPTTAILSPQRSVHPEDHKVSKYALAAAKILMHFFPFFFHLEVLIVGIDSQIMPRNLLRPNVNGTR